MMDSYIFVFTMKWFNVSSCLILGAVSESKAEIQGALWRIPPVDDTEPPALDSPGISPGSGHSRSLQLICTFDNKQENMRRLVCCQIILLPTHRLQFIKFWCISCYISVCCGTHLEMEVKLWLFVSNILSCGTLTEVPQQQRCVVMTTWLGLCIQLIHG